MEAITLVRTRMEDLKGEELSGLLLSLLDKARLELGEDMAIHPVRKTDAAGLSGQPGIGAALEDQVELPFELARLKGKDLIGGFIAISLDGKRVLDMSFHGILERDEDGIREMISKALFSKEQE